MERFFGGGELVDVSADLAKSLIENPNNAAEQMWK